MQSTNANGRVVVQSTRLEVARIGARAFELTADQAEEQARQNVEEMNHFMAQLSDAIEHGALDDEDSQQDE